MITEIGFYILFIIVTIRAMIISNDNDKPFYLDFLFIAGAVIFITMTPLLGHISGNTFNLNSQYSSVITNRTIASLERESGIEGSFLLGSGSIEDKPVYYVYFINKDGGYKIERLEEVVLYEDSSISPHYEEYKLCTKKVTWLNWNGNCTYYKKLFVPENTIIKEFKG